MKKHIPIIVVTLLLLAAFLSGCQGLSSFNPFDDTSSKFVGTWKLSGSNTGEYLVLNPDNTMRCDIKLKKTISEGVLIEAYNDIVEYEFTVTVLDKCTGNYRVDSGNYDLILSSSTFSQKFRYAVDPFSGGNDEFLKLMPIVISPYTGRSLLSGDADFTLERV